MVPIRESSELRGMAVVSVSLGFWSLVVFWWFPYSLFISSAGLGIALITLALGVRGRNGENFPLLGATLCGISLTIILTITQGLHILLWK
jgi:hypothetical protein